MKIAALQCSTLNLTSNRLEHYVKLCQDSEVEILLLPEYATTSFYMEAPMALLKAQSEHRIKLMELSKKYGVVIVAPVLLVASDRHRVRKALKKSIMLVNPAASCYFDQQILVHYEEWDEYNFYANSRDPMRQAYLPTFKYKAFTLGILSGFETHFDFFWNQAVRKNVDIMLVPTAACFQSKDRWRELLKSRAMLKGLHVLRANRLGSYFPKGQEIVGDLSAKLDAPLESSKGEVEEGEWCFYGDSFYVNSYGDLISNLDDQEGLLIACIEEHAVHARRFWGFEALRKRFLAKNLPMDETS